MSKKVQNEVIYTELPEEKTPKSRIFVQVMVSILVIAFIVSIGGMWNRGGDFPILLKTKHFVVDFSPRSLYQLEYDRQDRIMKEQGLANITPRQYKKILEEKILLSLEDQIVRQEFYRDIGLNVSPSQRSYVREKTGIVDPELQRFILSEQMALGPLGVLSLLAQIGTSDSYIYSDLANFVLNAEFLVLNKQNFLFSQISSEEKNQYYFDHLEDFAEFLTVIDIKVGKIAPARKLLKLLNEKGIEQGLIRAEADSELQNLIGKRSTIKISPTANNYDYFLEGLRAFKNKKNAMEAIVPKPIYEKGVYHVLIVKSVATFEQLSEYQKKEILNRYIHDKKQNIAKKYAMEWTVAREQFLRFSEQSFSTGASSILGAEHFISLPFTFLDKTVQMVNGTNLDLPVFTSSSILEALLETKLGEKSQAIQLNEDLIMFVRPLKRDIGSAREKNIINNQKIQQEAALFKETVMVKSISRPYFRKRYGLTVFDRTELKN